MDYAWIVFVFLIFSGCVSAPEYNPLQAAVHPELLLNESALQEVKAGMTVDQVHKIMGQELVIGYTSNKPLTIPNPYKLEKIKGTGYIIECYIADMRQTGGIISDNELMPLVFKDGKLIGRGWSLVNSLRASAMES